MKTILLVCLTMARSFAIPLVAIFFVASAAVAQEPPTQVDGQSVQLTCDKETGQCIGHLVKPQARPVPVAAQAPQSASSEPNRSEPAKNYRWEVGASTSSSLSFSSSTAMINAALGARYLIDYGIQLGMASVLTDAYSSSTNVSVTGLTFLAGPTFNLPINDIENAFSIDTDFGFTTAAVRSTALAGTTTSFTFLAGIGKRFKIAEHVSYYPGFSAILITNAPTQFTISPVGFSFFF